MAGGEYSGAGPEYAGGASELEDGLANGFATVGGFSGRRVGALNAPNGDFGGSMGEGDFDFDVVDVALGVRPNREDFRLKRLKAGIDVGELFLRRGEFAHSEDAEVSRMNGMVYASIVPLLVK